MSNFPNIPNGQLTLVSHASAQTIGAVPTVYMQSEGTHKEDNTQDFQPSVCQIVHPVGIDKIIASGDCQAWLVLTLVFIAIVTKGGRERKNRKKSLAQRLSKRAVFSDPSIHGRFSQAKNAANFFR